MGTQTENYKLTQPSPEDYNIFKDHNENMDIIDSQLKKLEREKEALIKKKSAFNKDFEVDAEKIAMNGTADVGVSDSIARGDHVHPTDTTRAAALHKHDGVYDTPDGVQKKIDAHANQAEPHAGHISHSLATAPNDFLVSSQAGRFVKKTVDEVKGILGFGTAAYTNATNFATAEQGTRADNALPATAYTASDVLEKLMTVDGNASGLDADLLDGKEATAFATAEQGVKADNALPATAYTASDVLEKIMTMDGEKSGLDADLLDGMEATAFATAEQGVKADNALPATAYTAGDVLTKLKTVDGENSGLDADLLDGKEATAFATAEQGTKADNALLATAYTASDVLTKLKTVDGEKSGLDADLLDGKEATAFATAEQGIKADNAATQANLNSHLTEYTQHKNTVGTETTVGHLEIADETETTAGTVNNKAVSPKNLKVEVDKKVPNSLATAASQFLVSSAVGQWAIKTIADVKVLLGLKSAAYSDSTAFATAEQGAKADNALPSTSYTASDVLAKLKAVDGNASGLDADLLDGKEATAFATAAQGIKADAAATQAGFDAHLSDYVKHITSAERTAWNAKQAILSDADILTKLKNVDGAGSGLDADLLDGRRGNEFAYSGIAEGDIDNIVQSGMYRLGDSATNVPSNTIYGQLIVIHGGFDTITQIATDYHSYSIYWRSGNPSNIGGGGTWQPWRTIWHSGYMGAGSGLDADLLDGNHASAFATAAQGVRADNAMPNTYGAVDVISSSYTLSTAITNQVIYCLNVSPITVTIPTNATAPFSIGTQITFIQRSNAVTFAPASGVALESKDTKRTIDGLYASATLIYLGSNTWSLIGTLA